MAKMGHVEGRGLGKNQQGIKEPINANPIRGRSGLGTHAVAVASDQGSTIDPKYDWTHEKEAKYVSKSEPIKWVTCTDDDQLTPEDLKNWIEYGPRELKPIESYDEKQEFFCDFEIISNINKYRSALDGLSDQQITQGRTLSNPFEGIGKGIFQNRAAMKMANIDSRFNFMFTRAHPDVKVKREKNPPPIQFRELSNEDEDEDEESNEEKKFFFGQDDSEEDEDENEKLQKDEILYFADICAGPGGFSEYVLFKQKWHAHGFGMTLRSSKSGVDWKLDNFIVASTETFEIHYGKDDDGDIYKPQNLKAFHEHIMKRTNGRGTHFVMADGGFSVEGQENYQEVLSKRLYLCQFLCALMNIRPGGHFTCKLFDCFTPFTVGLIYLMYRCFKKICIFKPNTSRPANSERYLICKGKNESTDSIENYFDQINRQLENITDDIVSIVPLEVMKRDGKFYNYIYRCNNFLGKRQILFLSKMKIFALDSRWPNPFNGLWNDQLFTEWHIPRDKFYRKTEQDRHFTLRSVLDSFESRSPPLNHHLLYHPRSELVKSEKFKSLEFIYSFKACLLTGPDPTAPDASGSIRLGDTTADRGLILVVSKANWYFKNTEKPNSKFEKFETPLILNLPRSTLVYGEMTWELEGQGTGRKKVRTVHLIDGLFLGGEDIRGETLEDRSNILAAFVQSVQNSSPSKSVLTQIRHRPLYNLDEIQSVVERIGKRWAKNGPNKLSLGFQLDERKYIAPTGLLFIAAVNLDNYLRCKSSKTGKLYYFIKRNGETVYEAPPGAEMKADDFYKHSLFWPWDPVTWPDRNVQSNHPESPEMTFQRQLLTLINSNVK